jgi:LysM repeat protein
MRRWLTIFLFVPLVALGGCMRKCNCASTVGVTTTTTTVGSGTSTTAATSTTSIVADTTTTTIPSEYIIQKGDRLSDIAKKFHLTVAEIAQANGISDPDKINYGQKLIIPKPGQFSTTTTRPPITPPPPTAPPATTIPNG